MAELDNNIEEKVSIVFKDEIGDEFDLNYKIDDNIITFFVSINEGKEISQESIDKIASIVDGAFEGSNIVNQEYRYQFNLDPCSD